MFPGLPGEEPARFFPGEFSTSVLLGYVLPPRTRALSSTTSYRAGEAAWVLLMRSWYRSVQAVRVSEVGETS